jgi:hypothetical protein
MSAIKMVPGCKKAVVRSFDHRLPECQPAKVENSQAFLPEY